MSEILCMKLCSPTGQDRRGFWCQEPPKGGLIFILFMVLFILQINKTCILISIALIESYSKCLLRIGIANLA